MQQRFASASIGHVGEAAGLVTKTIDLQSRGLKATLTEVSYLPFRTKDGCHGMKATLTEVSYYPDTFKTKDGCRG